MPEDNVQPPVDENDQAIDNRIIHLPAVISDEFGTPRSEARIELANATIEIDGVQWDGDRFDIPLEALWEKQVVINGTNRQFRFVYRDREDAGHRR